MHELIFRSRSLSTEPRSQKSFGARVPLACFGTFQRICQVLLSGAPPLPPEPEMLHIVNKLLSWKLTLRIQ